MNFFKGPIIIIVAILGIIYLALLPLSANGYGYPGYYGYHRGGSFFYWGGPNYYPSQRSARTGSIGGTGQRGGGLSSGK